MALMRAVAIALVLIAGAAVMLWYGNTLNSWVLGGLIGGLAAILLSIPISLALFSFFTRRQGQQQIEEQEELEALPEAPQGAYTRSRVNVVEAEHVEYVDEIGDEDELAYDEDDDYDEQDEDGAVWREQRQRSLPSHYVPPARYLPPAPQHRSSMHTRHHTSKIPVTPSYNRYNTETHLSTREFQEYEPASQRGTQRLTRSLSSHRSQALRAARREAAQQAEYSDHEYPPSMGASRTYGATQNLRPSTGGMTRGGASRRSTHGLRGSDHIVDSYPPSRGNSRREIMPEDEDAYYDERYEDADLDEIYPEAYYDEPPRSPQRSRAPGQAMVRRAPYMYEDDEIYEESQHVEPPVRRRSRYLDQH